MKHWKNRVLAFGEARLARVLLEVTLRCLFLFLVFDQQEIFVIADFGLGGVMRKGGIN